MCLDHFFTRPICTPQMTKLFNFKCSKCVENLALFGKEVVATLCYSGCFKTKIFFNRTLIYLMLGQK